jgi:hypothetical protein
MKKYVKEYMGHKVPEGATCFVEACAGYKNHFGKDVNGVEYVFVVDMHQPEWSEISHILPLSLRGAIELPEAKWEPAVGEYYLVKHAGTFVNCFYIGKDIDGRFAYQVTEGKDVYELDSTDLADNFKPLKSDEEIERDAFIAAFIQATSPFTSSYDIAVSLFDADFKAPMEKND